MLAVNAGFKGGAKDLKNALRNGFTPYKKLSIAGMLITVPSATVIYILLNPLNQGNLYDLTFFYKGAKKSVK